MEIHLSFPRYFFKNSKISSALQLVLFTAHFLRTKATHKYEFSWCFFVDQYQTTFLFWSWLLFRLKSQFVSGQLLGPGKYLNSLCKNLGCKIFHHQNNLGSCMLFSTGTSETQSGPFWHFYPNVTGRTFSWLMLCVSAKTKRMSAAILHQVHVSTSSVLSCVSVVDSYCFTKRM